MEPRTFVAKVGSISRHVVDNRWRSPVRTVMVEVELMDSFGRGSSFEYVCPIDQAPSFDAHLVVTLKEAYE